MSDREDLAQAVRSVIKQALSLTDAQVIIANSNGPRPPVPYLTVKVATHDILTGVVEDWTVHGDDGGGNPTKAPQGPRQATIEVTAYGATALDWLEALPDYLRQDAVTIGVARTAGVVFQGFGTFTDVSTLVDLKVEARAIRVLQIRYERLGTAFTVGEFVYGELDTTLNSHTGPGSVTLDLTLDPDAPLN